MIRILKDPSQLAPRPPRMPGPASGRPSRGAARARIIAATGASQIAFLDRLVREPGHRVARGELFHLDEYIGLSTTIRRASGSISSSGCRPSKPTTGTTPRRRARCRRGLREVGRLLRQSRWTSRLRASARRPPRLQRSAGGPSRPTRRTLVVRLDDRCRQQQVGEGWFAGLSDVPETAISMSVRQILEARAIMCVVPDRRKAEAVRASVDGPNRIR